MTMDKNYYEILEVDKKASPEIIDKAYKTLAKKYHPDLQDDIHKKEAEKTFKMINEAYEVLSNPEQRALYDQKIENTVISQDKYNEILKQNHALKNQLKNLQQQIHDNLTYSQNIHDAYNTNRNHNNNHMVREDQHVQSAQHKKNLQLKQQIHQARQQAYQDAYTQDMENRGYTIQYKKSFSDYLKSLISLAIVILILFLIFQLPFVKNYFIELYHTNSLVRVISNIFINLFQ